MIDEFPRFRPHPLIRSGHAQTILGSYARGERFPYRARQLLVPLDDGDRIVLHDDCPAAWREGERTVLLIHGLGGSHASPCVARVAGRLNERGFRTFRMDMRGAGAGYELAQQAPHAGRSEDAAAAARAIDQICPGSPITLVGFSMGGNVVLKLLGERSDFPPGGIDSGVAVAPPIRILTCALHMRRGLNRLYTQAYLKSLMRDIRRRQQFVSELAKLPADPFPQDMFEFDARFTVPWSGFESVHQYYKRSSAAPWLAHIKLPTLIIVSADDPIVPFRIFKGRPLGARTRLLVTERGGHVGYIGVAGVDPDRRWLDWRIVDWVARRAADAPPR